MLTLRSALYNVVLWLSVPVYALIVLLAFPLPFTLRYRIVAQWGRFHIWLLKILCRLDYRMEGREHLPEGPAILLAKHQSTWETIAFQAIFPPLVWVLKRELIWIPLFGWALSLLQSIAIDRGAGRRAVEQVVDQGRRRLRSGLWVVIFPEGTRMAPGCRRRYGISGAMLASKTGYPVVPLAHNAGTYWPRRGFMKRPGTIRVVIGPVIQSRGKSAEEIRRQTEDWIENEMLELERSN